MAENKQIRGECSDCGHVWVVAHLPMQLSLVAELCKTTRCPGYGGGAITVASRKDQVAP